LTVIQHISILHRPSVVVSNVQLIDGSDLAEEERSRKAVSVLGTMGKFDFVPFGSPSEIAGENTNREQALPIDGKSRSFKWKATSRKL
jgi:hypothetical protein